MERQRLKLKMGSGRERREKEKWFQNEIEKSAGFQKYFHPIFLISKLSNFKDGETLIDGNLIDDGHQLHVAEVMERHAGRYECLAENSAGKAEKSILVSIRSSCVNI